MRATGSLVLASLLMVTCPPGAAHADAASSAQVFTPKAYFYFRPETATNRTDADFDAGDTEFNFALRGDYGARLSLPRDVNLVFQLQSIGTYTVDDGPLDDSVSLYEAYAEMAALGPFTLAFGRKMLGDYGGLNVMSNRSFDGGLSFETVRLRYQSEALTSDVMWAQLYHTRPGENGADPVNLHPVWAGVYNTWRIDARLTLDFYAFVLEAMPMRGYTITAAIPGFRAVGAFGGLSYSGELLYQTGGGSKDSDASATATISAYLLEAAVRYRFDGALHPTLGATFYRASGDDDPTDDSIATLFKMWPDHHGRFGYMDMFAGPNLQVETLFAEVAPSTDWHLGVRGVAAQAAEAADPALGALPTGTAVNSASDPDLGFGADLYSDIDYSEHLFFQFALATWFPGTYFENNLGSADMMLPIYLQAAVRY